MTTDPALSEAQQINLLLSYLPDAEDFLRRLLADESRCRVLKRLAMDRMVDNVDKFGDAMWHKHPDDLMVETLEELADALVYLAARRFAQVGTP